jgi:hypothetical protein
MAPDPIPEKILRLLWRVITESFLTPVKIASAFNTKAQLLSSRYLYGTPFVFRGQ